MLALLGRLPLVLLLLILFVIALLFIALLNYCLLFQRPQRPQRRHLAPLARSDPPAAFEEAHEQGRTQGGSVHDIPRRTQIHGRSAIEVSELSDILINRLINPTYFKANENGQRINRSDIRRAAQTRNTQG